MGKVWTQTVILFIMIMMVNCIPIIKNWNKKDEQVHYIVPYSSNDGFVSYPFGFNNFAEHNATVRFGTQIFFILIIKKIKNIYDQSY